MTDEKIAAISRRAAATAQPELDIISEQVIKRHKLDTLALDNTTLMMVGLALNDTQHQSFNLGVQIGAHLMLELIHAQDRG